jgi:hypothetical protein
MFTEADIVMLKPFYIGDNYVEINNRMIVDTEFDDLQDLVDQTPMESLPGEVKEQYLRFVECEDKDEIYEVYILSPTGDIEDCSYPLHGKDELLNELNNLNITRGIGYYE